MSPFQASLFLSSLRLHHPVISVQVSRRHLTPPISKAAFLFLLPKPPEAHSLLCLGKDTSTLLLFQGKPCSQSLTLSFSHPASHLSGAPAGFAFKTGQESKALTTDAAPALVRTVTVSCSDDSRSILMGHSLCFYPYALEEAES